MATKPICTIAGCEKPRLTHGMCNFHWRRLKRGVDLHAPSTHLSRGQPMAFMMGLIGTDVQTCITWPFATNGRDGRGVIKIDGRMQQVHRTLCALIHGEPPTPEHEAAHECGKGHEACVNPNHLSWKTSVENKADQDRHGTRRRGSDVVGSKMTEDEVAEMRRLSREGATQHQLARRYGINQVTVWSIVHRKTWAHVKDDN